MELIRLRRCAGWSAPLLFANPRRQVFSRQGPIVCMLGNFHAFVVHSLLTFQKVLSGTLSECQMVWVKIRTDILSVLICVQTICQDYQKTTKGTASKERGNSYHTGYFYRLHYSPVFIQIICSTSVVTCIYKQSRS